MHELPPLLVHGTQEGTPLSEMVGMAAGIVEAKDILGDVPDDNVLEKRKYDMALNLAEQYIRLMAHWQWSDSILEWIRQCEITFESSEPLRGFLHPDVSNNHALTSFVTLFMA